MDDDDSSDEILLKENKHRFVLFPIQYDAIWKMYKKHEASFWTAEEIDLGHDMKDWIKLTAGEQHFLKMVLAFFAASDGIVLENLAERFMREIQLPEVCSFSFFFFLFEKRVHRQWTRNKKKKNRQDASTDFNSPWRMSIPRRILC